MKAPRFEVDPSLCVRWVGGRLSIQLPASSGELETSQSEILSVLSAFGRGSTPDHARRRVPQLSGTDFEVLTNALVSAGALRRLDSPYPPAWGPTEIGFHSQWRERGTAVRAAARRPLPRRPARLAHSARVALPQAQLSGPIETLLSRRTSVRRFAKRPLPLQTFSDFLAAACGDRSAPDGGFHRAYPSVGNSLEVYPILARGAVDGLKPGIYHFRPRARDLEWLGLHRRSCALFLQAAGAAMETLPETPPVVLALASRVPELARQYPDALAYALVMREVGCLLQTCSLVAVSLKLGSCLLGRGLPTRFLTAATGIPWQTEALVGELALGIPASELTAPRKRSPGRARPAR